MHLCVCFQFNRECPLPQNHSHFLDCWTLIHGMITWFRAKPICKVGSAMPITVIHITFSVVTWDPSNMFNDPNSFIPSLCKHSTRLAASLVMPKNMTPKCKGGRDSYITSYLLRCEEKKWMQNCYRAAVFTSSKIMLNFIYPLTSPRNNAF